MVLEASDVDADAIELEGKVHRRVLLRPKQTYMTEVGEVEVEPKATVHVYWMRPRARGAGKRGAQVA